MRNRNIITILLSLQILLLLSCGEELEFRTPLENDNTVPSGVSEIQVESLPGGAKIIYTVPNEPNISHVKAKYLLASGREREVKASIYNNHLIVEGFADTLEHEIKVHTVTKSNVESSPVSVKVKPLEAAIWKVHRSITFKDHFGGYNLEAENPDTALVSVFVMEKNDFGEFEVNNLKSFATSLTNINSKIRGMDTLEYEFKYFVMDHWKNTTDTATVFVKPLFETEIPKSGFKAYNLPGDAPQVTNGARLEYAWDNRLGWPYTSFTYQATGGSGPHIITFDMGVEAKLSRFWYRPYPEYWWQGDAATQWFFLSTMKKFEVYGSVNPTNNGALDESWILLGTYEIIKPSGSPYGQDTDEDKRIAEKGFNFELDINAPKVRYIRIKCNENYGGGTAQSINELSMYGDPR